MIRLYRSERRVKTDLVCHACRTMSCRRWHKRMDSFEISVLSHCYHVHQRILLESVDGLVDLYNLSRSCQD